jgi:SAM-dependent methyltransferase
MFSIPFLHEIRAAELLEAARFIPPRSRVLEIGGGTGFQARLLHEMGHSVECIDLPQSTYAEHRTFPVREFDGATIPFAAAEFDLVLSSNVLEHVASLPRLLAETRRVLKPGGRCLHLLPSVSWRAWTILTHYPNLPFLLWARLTGRGDNPFPIPAASRGLAHLLGRAVWPGRHGEAGTMLSELWLFGRRRWLREFHAAGFHAQAVRPIGLFYTGNMLFGARLGLASRRTLARWAGSGSTLYVLEARGVPNLAPAPR